MYKLFINNLMLQVLILIWVFFFISGCGKKAPPKPPHQVLLPAVNDLSLNKDGDKLNLSWSVPKVKEKIIQGLAGFIVCRSKKPISAFECRNCPIMFERVADIPIDIKSSGSLKKDTMTYTETLEKGYSYAYKVTAYGDNGMRSHDSNYVEFVF